MSSTDFVLLQDLSGSFADDLPVLQSLAEPLVETLLREDKTAKVAVASFIDKPQSPFGAIGDFVYRTNQVLTNSSEEVLSTLNALTTSSGADIPEAQLEALLQAALRGDELGYRNHSTRYILLSTDAPFHKAGDGLLGLPPITQPNNGDAIVDADEDYPSFDQLRTVLEENNVIPIFAVTPAVLGDYNNLVSILGRGAVVNLTENSANLTDATRLGFAVVRNEVTIRGSISIDILVGTRGADGIFGDLGDDRLFGRGRDDLLDGGAGDDVLRGQAGDDTVRGGTGRDRLIGGGGDDDLDGGLDNDRIRGGAGDDVCIGDDGNDRMNGGNGDDRMLGGNGRDRIRGENGDDRITGGNSRDILRGGAGEDTLLGGNGRDLLIGDDDNDILRAGRGRDVLVGVAVRSETPGMGEIDTLLSGSGNDLYVLGNRRGVFYDDGIPGDPIADEMADGTMDTDSDESSDNSDDSNNTGNSVITDASRGLDDYALIGDFSPTQDTIQIFGEAADYILEEMTLDLSEGVGIFWTGDGGSGELIGLVEDEAIANLSLENSGQFQYVG
ncbi:MAG: hypothetical protein AB4042_06255 [Leptolyngbyaceae cyanobacterium]